MGCTVRASASQGKVNSSLDSVSGQLVGGIREEESQSGHICLEAFTLQGHAQLDVCDKLESLYKGPSKLSQLHKVDSHKEIWEDGSRNRGRSTQGALPQVRLRRVVPYMTRVAFWTAVCSREDFQKAPRRCPGVSEALPC